MDFKILKQQMNSNEHVILVLLCNFDTFNLWTMCWMMESDGALGSTQNLILVTLIHHPGSLH